MRLGLGALALVCLVGGCDRAPDLALDIRFPADKHLLQAVARVNMTATRDAVVLASSSTSASAGSISLSGLSHGARTVIQLDGVDSSGTVIARGRTCPVDFESSGTRAPLYFAPTNFFAPTPGDPTATRTRPVALALDSGDVLIAGGADGTGTALASSETFAPGSASFTSGIDLPHARAQAEAVAVPSVGPLVVGGSAGGTPVAGAELYLPSLKQYQSISNSLLTGRVGHRVVLLNDNRAFVSGGTDGNQAPLASTVIVYVDASGGNKVVAGPTMAEARSDHAATVAIGVPMVFGGFGDAGKTVVLDSIEALDISAAASATPAKAIGHLTTARAEATASLLGDGTILIVGGVDASHVALDTAELFNPITRTTTVYQMAVKRHGHSATVLSDGRVLVAGGKDANDAALTSVELFAPDVGFLTERSLGSARADHAAVSLCDGTVLVVGGAAGAELYSEPAN